MPDYGTPRDHVTREPGFEPLVRLGGCSRHLLSSDSGLCEVRFRQHGQGTQMSLSPMSVAFSPPVNPHLCVHRNFLVIKQHKKENHRPDLSMIL